MRRGWAAAVLALALGCFLKHHEPPPGGDAKAGGESREGRGGESGGGERSAARPKAAHRPEAPDEPAEKGVPSSGERPPVPAAPEALLAPGAVGSIQQALEARGYLAEAHRRGELDEATSRGIRKFQEDEGLAATGMPDRETLDRLGVNPNAAYGRDEPKGR